MLAQKEVSATNQVKKQVHWDPRKVLLAKSLHSSCSKTPQKKEYPSTDE